jgi:hypothetical protein
MFTYQAALDAINNANTVDEIRSIIGQTNFIAPNTSNTSVSVFYQATMSGQTGDHVWQYLNPIQAASNGQVKLLNMSTDVIQLLNNNDVLIRLAQLQNVAPTDTTAMQALKAQYFEGHTDTAGVYHQGFWDIPSENMAAAAKGNILVVAPFGGLNPDGTLSAGDPRQ